MKKTLLLTLILGLTLAACSEKTDNTPTGPEVTIASPLPNANYEPMDSVDYDIAIAHIRPIDSISLTIKRITPDTTVLVFTYTPPDPVSSMQLNGYWQNDLIGTDIDMMSVLYIHDIQDNVFRDTVYFTCN